MSTASFFEGYGPDNPLIMTAAGLCKTFSLNAIEPLAAAADRVVVGSMTLDARAGNEGTCEYFDNPLYSVNAWGMPNPGADAAPTYDESQAGDEIGSADRFDAVRPKIIVSLAEFSVQGYHDLFRRLVSWGSAVELNFGCPNVRDDGTQHKIVSFDPAVLAQILDAIGTYEAKESVGVKLSPYSDPGLLKEVAAVVAAATRPRIGNIIDYVAVTNTFPNGRAYTPSRASALDTKQAGPVGGIAGEALKPISLSNAAQFRDALPDSIHVIRVGGISSGEDVWQSYDIGCTGVQIATAIAREGVGVLTRIRQEYADIVG